MRASQERWNKIFSSYTIRQQNQYDELSERRQLVVGPVIETADIEFGIRCDRFGIFVGYEAFLRIEIYVVVIDFYCIYG